MNLLPWQPVRQPASPQMLYSGSAGAAAGLRNTMFPLFRDVQRTASSSQRSIASVAYNTVDSLWLLSWRKQTIMDANLYILQFAFFLAY